MKPLLLILIFTTGISAQITTNYHYQYKITGNDTTLISKVAVEYIWSHNDKMTIIQRRSLLPDVPSLAYHLQDNDYSEMPRYLSAKYISTHQSGGLAIIGMTPNRFIAFIRNYKDSNYIQLYTNEDTN
jgi:hypothetical protein